MDWRRTRSGERLVEWERADGLATVRVRERADGRYTVRYDRLEQAPAGAAYRHRVVPDREAATDLAAEWRANDDGGGSG
ncbi:MAG: hypothetical protein ABEJ61_06735 [Haloferacaceae archaeon]